MLCDTVWLPPTSRSLQFLNAVLLCKILVFQLYVIRRRVGKKFLLTIAERAELFAGVAHVDKAAL